MANDEYPEVAPTELAPLNEQVYPVRFTETEAVSTDLQDQIDRLTDRIDKIVENVTINAGRLGEIRIVGHLLGLTHDPEELDMLGRALCRVGPLVGQLDKLNGRQELVKTLRDEPGWFLSVFGDFANDVDYLERNKDHLS